MSINNGTNFAEALKLPPEFQGPDKLIKPGTNPRSYTALPPEFPSSGPTIVPFSEQPDLDFVPVDPSSEVARYNPLGLPPGYGPDFGLDVNPELGQVHDMVYSPTPRGNQRNRFRYV